MNVTLVCDTCGKEFERQKSSVREQNYCSKSCLPQNIYHGEKWELIRAVAVGTNDPTPQIRHYLVKRAWMQFALPDGCVLRSMSTKKLLIVKNGEFVSLSQDEWDASTAPNPATRLSKDFKSQTALHERVARCPGAAWEA